VTDGRPPKFIGPEPRKFIWLRIGAEETSQSHIPQFWPIYLLIKKQAENNRSNVVFFSIFGLALGKEVLDAKRMDIFILILEY
jgi:hypothetical protein